MKKIMSVIAACTLPFYSSNSFSAGVRSATEDQLVSVQDAPLSCNWDIDFSCNAWNENRDVALLVRQIEQMEFEYTLTQDDVENVYDVNNVFATLLLTIPLGYFGQLLARYTVGYVAQLVAAYAGWELADAFADALASLEYKAGDVIVIRNGEIVEIKRELTNTAADAIASEIGFSGDTANSAPYSGATSAWSMSSYNTTLTCRIVYTGSGENLTASEVCFIP